MGVEEPSMEWYRPDISEVMAAVGASPNGLSTSEAASRLQRHGLNTVATGRRRSPLTLFFRQFTDFMILVLLAAAVVSGLLGHATDTAVIIAIVVLNACIGFIQEYRAEQAMAALQRMAAPHAVVLRDDEQRTIASSEVVPGDLVLLQGGDVVPADLRLLEASRLTLQEGALTGESAAVGKVSAPIDQSGVPLGDQKNLCFKGTVVTSGRGRGVVVATGADTELGRIATLLGAAKEVATPLQRRLTAFGRRLSVAILSICFLIFCAGVLRGEQALAIFLTAVSLAVAAIPEALPAVVTISLALGAKKLADSNSLVRHLPAVETLGSVTTICTDKTGTLTEGRMVLHSVSLGSGPVAVPDVPQRAPDEEGELLFWEALALCNDVSVDSSGEAHGEPTELALFLGARTRGIDGELLRRRYPRLTDLPFDEARKLMTTVHSREGEVVAFTKGAPEAVLARTAAQAGGGPCDAAGVLRIAERMAADGMRVLAVALRRLPAATDLAMQRWEEDLSFLGLAGILDPPRPEAARAVTECREAGITPVMITGDHALTALSIARKLGVCTGDDALLSAERLGALRPEELPEVVAGARVYARVTPEQKLQIVQALQERGEVVAMTGDGVNDAPALKRAEIGVAMGVAGTDVAKEAADLILLDDNFATIVRAIREGRRIYDNMRKFIRYLLTTNAGEIVAVAFAPFLGLPIPLVPVQILWINLMTDALPALALSVEPAEGDVMARPPRPPGEGVFAHGLGTHVVLVGILIGALVLGTEGVSLRGGNRHWQTMAFTVLCFTQLFHVLAIRSERESLFTIGLFSNPAVLGAVLLSVALQLLVVYLPPLNPLFATAPLSAVELCACIGVSAVVFVAVEAEKLVRRRSSH